MAGPTIDRPPSFHRARPIVCRFVPHDQWLLTHVPLYWKGKDIKHHLLAKCLNLSCPPPDPPTRFTASQGLASGGGLEERPPSPITFAPDPLDRPPSPILFAATTPTRFLHAPDDNDAESEGEDEGEDDEGDAETLDDTASRIEGGEGKGKGRLVDDDGVGIGGARVVPTSSTGRIHHKGSASSGLNSLSNHASSASFGVSFAPSIDSRSTLVNGVAAPSIPDGRAVPPTAHLSFSLVRFATGQIIEDEYPLSDYDVSPHELLELHLSIAPLSPDHHHSLSSVAGYLPPTPTFPFPLVPSPAPRKLKGKKKKAAAALMHAGGTRLVALPRTVCERYAEPYWEGWIRILRFSCRDEEDYMYGGSGGGRGKGAGEGKADKGAGPGFAQYGAASLDGWGHSGNQILGEAREREVDGMLGRDAIVGFGFGGLPNKATGRGSGRATAGESAPRSRFEWRERWVIIRDGWIFLLKERGDPTPSHSFPLRNLVNLRDADHLTASLDSAKDRRMRAGKDQVRSTRAKEGYGYDAERYRREKDRLQASRAVPSTGGLLPSPTSTIKPSPNEAQRSVSRSQGHSHSHSQSWVAAEEGIGGLEQAGGTRPATASAHACKPHPHSQSSSSATRPANATTASSGRPVVSRDPRDALARYHASPRTFVPSNKEEADLVGMRIVCAKFRQASAREREGVPDPFSGVLDHAAGEDGGVMKRLYTSTAPSLADVQGVGVGIAAGLIQGGFLDPEWDKEGRGVEKEGRYEQRTRPGGAEREKDRPRDREREKAERDKAARDALRASERQLWEDVNWISPARRSKARDKDKGKTGSKGELASFGGLGSADGRLIAADRRPSLPTFASSAGSVSGDGHTLVSASSSMSLMSIFTGRGGGEKEDKKREKKREKDGRKREKEDNKRQPDTDSVGVTSSGSWYLGRRKGSGGGNARKKESPQIAESSGAMPVNMHLPDNASAPRDVDMDSDEGSSPSVEGSDMNHGPPSQVNQFEGVEAPARVQNQVSFQSANKASDSDSDDPTSPVFAREDDDDGDSDLDFADGVSPKRHELNRAPIGHPDAHSSGQELSGSTTMGLPDVREEGTSSPAGQAHPPPPVPTTSGSHRARSASVTTASTVRNRHPTARKPEPLKGQWIIMDLGSDAAYHSLLRILHRSLGQPLASSFLQALPGLAISPSPVTPLARDYNPRRSNSLLHLGSPSSPSRIRSLSDATYSLGQTRYAADDASRTATPVGGSIQHPPQLDTLVRDHLSRSQVIGRTLGALPYPEWRHDIVMRSQRAGLGVVARPLEIILFAMGEKRQEGYYFDDPCLVVRQPEPEPIRIQGSPRVENDTSLTPVESDDGSYEDKEVLVLDENSSDESEMEWQAWHVDLDRQYQAQREKRDIVSTNPPPPQSSVLALDQDKSEDDNLELLPTTTAEERVLATKKRHDHGPCGVITSLYTSTALQGFAAPQDGVHEHHEDAAHRRAHQSRRKWMPAAAHGLTSRSLIAEHPRASSGSDQGTYSHGTLSSGYLQPPLRHSSSMQSSLFAPSDGWSASHEGPIRQPSLTALGGATTTTTTTEQSFTLTPNSFGMAIRELKGQDGSDDHGDDHRGPQAQYVTDSAPGSPVSHHHSPSSASLLSGSPPPSSILRHHLPSSSVGLAASPIKPNVLRKKTSARDFEGEAVMANARGRPALTVSTSAPLAPRQLELVEADRRAKPAAKSPTGSNVQGDSEFKSEDEHQLTSPKKKKSGTFERFVRAF